jgi:hypothetical protein
LKDKFPPTKRPPTDLEEFFLIIINEKKQLPVEILAAL